MPPTATGVLRAADDMGVSVNPRYGEGKMASLEDVLKGNVEETKEPEVEAKEEKPEQEAAAETPEKKPEEPTQEGEAVSDEEPAPKGEEKAAPPAAEKIEPNAPIAALLDERDKRQRLERELEELKKSQAPAEPEADFFEDPEGALKKRDAAFREELLKNKLDMSQAMAKESHPDFDEVLGKFNKAMETDPSLKGRAKIIWDDALNQPHPALSIYKAVQRELAVQEISDPTEYRKKIEAEIRAELAKEKEAPAEEKPAPSIPESLADERSVGSRKGPEWTGPTPLGEIIKSA